MRLSVFVMMAAASVTIAQTCASISLLSCVAAPVSTICPSNAGNDYSCVCSQLSAQNSCYPLYCPTSSFGSVVASQFNKLCNGGNSPATATGSGATATAPAATPATTTAASATKTGAADILGIPAVAGAFAAFACGAAVAL